MMGIPIAGESYTYCDNASAVLNLSVPESMLKKKSNAIAYHYMHGSVAVKEQVLAHKSSETNLADLMIKCLPSRDKQNTHI